MLGENREFKILNIKSRRRGRKGERKEEVFPTSAKKEESCQEEIRRNNSRVQKKRWVGRTCARSP